jgi:hypothetical protein
MTALASFRHLARGGQPVEQKHSTLPDTDQPGVSVTALFPFQSYYDTALLEKALLQQSKNEPIVNSLTPALGAVTPMIKTNVGGYTFGLHPSSQTPVAVLPLVGGQPSSPQPIVVKPGQIIRPHGRPHAGNGNFSALQWGIPFGWLGGGMATLYIFPSPDADAAWPSSPEIIFHRQRMQILAPAALPVAAPKNWPTRFPWTQALRGASSVDQSGQAVIAIEPTRVLMTLRLTALAAASRMRILMHETNDFGLDANGAVIPGEAIWQDYTWGTYTALAGPNFVTAYPVVEPAGPWYRIAADDGGISLADVSAAGGLTNAYVDVERLGRL